MRPDLQPASVVPCSDGTLPPSEWWLELSERLAICARQLRQLIARHCEELDLNEAQLSLLWACLASPAGGQSQKELADRLLVSPAHVSGVVEQLRQAGLLVSRRDVHDRRRQQWQLTPAGQARLQAVHEHLADWTRQCECPPELQDLPQQIQQLTVALAGPATTDISPLATWTGTTLAECPDQQRGAA